MKIKEAREAYTKKDSRGYKTGARAFANMSQEQLVDTARNVAKQTNRQFKKMVDAGYQSPAVRGLIKEVSGVTDLQGLTPDEKYQAGKISVSVNDSPEVLRSKIEESIKFMEAKTHTEKGTLKAEQQAIQTLAQKTDINLNSISRDQRNAMWRKIEEMKNDQGIFAADWAIGSTKVLEKIIDHMEMTGNDDISSLIDDFINFEYYGGRQNESLNSLFYD